MPVRDAKTVQESAIYRDFLPADRSENSVLLASSALAKVVNASRFGAKPQEFFAVTDCTRRSKSLQLRGLRTRDTSESDLRIGPPNRTSNGRTDGRTYVDGPHLDHTISPLPTRTCAYGNFINSGATRMKHPTARQIADTIRADTKARTERHKNGRHDMCHEPHCGNATHEYVPDPYQPDRCGWCANQTQEADQ